MRVLVTGGAGFAGRFLLGELTSHGHDVVSMDVNGTAPLAPSIPQITCDLRDRAAVSAGVHDAAPDACVHLAAMTFVPDGDATPGRMLEVNVAGTVHLLDALRAHVPACRTLVVSSSHVYTFGTADAGVTEDTPLAPVGLYGISKTAADAAAIGYARRYGFPALVARPDNHTGPGQGKQFVVPSFVSQVRTIADGRREAVMRVGNLDCRRAFMDVRDVVVAYRLLLEKGSPAEAYNISTGELIRVGDLLDTICELAGVRPRIEVDLERFRPTDAAPVLDSSKLRNVTGWSPAYDLRRTLADMLGIEGT